MNPYIFVKETMETKEVSLQASQWKSLVLLYFEIKCMYFFSFLLLPRAYCITLFHSLSYFNKNYSTIIYFYYFSLCFNLHMYMTTWTSETKTASQSLKTTEWRKMIIDSLFLSPSLVSHFLSLIHPYSVYFIITSVLSLCGLCSPVINKGGFHKMSKKVDHWLLKCGKAQASLLTIKYYYLSTRHFDILNIN